MPDLLANKLVVCKYFKLHLAQILGRTIEILKTGLLGIHLNVVPVFYAGVNPSAIFRCLAIVRIKRSVFVVVEWSRHLGTDYFLLLLERQLVLFELAIEPQFEVIHAKPLSGDV